MNIFSELAFVSNIVYSLQIFCIDWPAGKEFGYEDPLNTSWLTWDSDTKRFPVLKWCLTFILHFHIYQFKQCVKWILRKVSPVNKRESFPLCLCNYFPWVSRIWWLCCMKCLMELNRPYRKTNIPAILNKALICAIKEIKMNPWDDIVRDQG